MLRDILAVIIITSQAKISMLYYPPVATPVLTLDTFSLPYSGGPSQPFAMVADASGNLWVNAGPPVVFKVSIASGALLATSALLPNLPFQQYIAFDGARVWSMGQNPSPTTPNLIYVLTNGVLTSQFATSGGRWPQSVVFDGTFMRIVAQPVSPTTSSRVFRMDAAGTISGAVTIVGSPGGDGPCIAFDGINTWAIVGSNLYKLSAANAIIGTFPFTTYTTSGNLSALSFDGTALWASDFNGVSSTAGNLIKINVTTGALIAAYPQTVRVQTLTSDGAGNIWFLGDDFSGGTGYVGIFNIATAALVLPLTSLGVYQPPSTSGPNQIYSDGLGHVWISTLESTLKRGTLTFINPPAIPKKIIDPGSIPVHHLPFCHRKECIFS